MQAENFIAEALFCPRAQNIPREEDDGKRDWVGTKLAQTKYRTRR